MSFRSLGLLTALAAVLCIGSTAGAETVTFQDGLNNPLTGSAYEGTEDNWTMWLSHVAGSDNRNYGTSTSLITGVCGNDTDRTYRYKSLLRFDLTSLAGEYASIDSATLRLCISGENASFDNNLQLFRFTAANGDWVEGTANGTAQTGSPCWNYRKYNATPWASGTPGTAPADYVGGINGYIASTAFTSTQPNGWMELAFTDLSFINDWVAGTNSGMVLRVEDESKYSTLYIDSSETTDASLRPQLVIEYTLIPEPGTLALLATGLIGLLCYAWRKRK